MRTFATMSTVVRSLNASFALKKVTTVELANRFIRAVLPDCHACTNAVAYAVRSVAYDVRSSSASVTAVARPSAAVVTLRVTLSPYPLRKRQAVDSPVASQEIAVQVVLSWLW